MDTEAMKLQVHVTAWPHPPAPGSFTNVIIKQDREFEEFIIDENDDTITSLGSYPDPSSSDPLLYLNFLNFQPNYVYQLLLNQLHDRVLSEQLAHQIVTKAQQQTSHSLDLPQFLIVCVKLTHKVYNVVPCNSAPLVTDSDQESPEEEESETCSICLENLSRSEDYCQMPNCCHRFHEICIIDWLNRHKDTCPLCRQPIYKQPESN